MARLVVVQTEPDVPQDGGVFQHPKHRQTGGPAAGHIVVLPPVLWVERDVGEQIDWALKHREPVTDTSPMEAAPWVTALHIDAEGPACVMGAALVGMTGNAVLIFPDEHGVVVFFIFVDKPGVDEDVQHVTLDVPLLNQIGIDAAHGVVGGWQFKLLFFHLSLLLCWGAGACH